MIRRNIKRIVHNFEGQLPLSEVIAVASAKNKRLGELDTAISEAIRTIERRFFEMGIQRIVSTKFPDGADLAWSRRQGKWRFIIRVDDIVNDLLSCPRDERAEVFTCGAMMKLVEQVLQP